MQDLMKIKDFYLKHKKVFYKAVLIGSFIVTSIFLFRFLIFYYQSEQFAQEHAKNEAHKAAAMIESGLRNIEAQLNSYAMESSSRSVSDSEIMTTFKNTLSSSKSLFGLAIAYAPYEYSPNERLHSVLATLKNADIGFSTIEKSYDYTEVKHEWYNRPIAEGPVWSKPFWGQASNAMVVTYSVPVHRQKADGTKRHVATLVAICSLNNLNDMVSSLDLGSSGYGFIVYKDSTFIAHPAEQLVLDKVKMVDYAKRNYTAKNQEIISQGFLDYTSFSYQEPTKLTNQLGIISLEPIKSIDWFVGSVLVKTEISFQQKDAKRHGIFFVFALIISVLLFIGYLIISHDRDYLVCKLTLFAAVLTLTFAAGLLSIWSMEIEFGLPSPHEDKGYIADKGSLAKHLQRWNKLAIDQHKEPRQHIPTGILINSIRMTNLNETEISGVVWQKIPVDTDGTTANEGVQLPFAVKSVMEETYRFVENGVAVIGWNFTATLPQHFDNTLYPFDRLQIKTLLRPKNLLARAQLIPDFASYDVYAPSANPFIIKDLFLPGWHTKQTYFTLLDMNYATTFGHINKSLTDDAQDLALTITIQREILNNFISVFLPMIMLAIISYVALLLSSGDEKKIAVFWFRPSNMQAVVATFLLFLVFSTINIRSRIVSDRVIYVEYMYFFMYFVIFGLIVSSTKIALRNENSIFGYRDGFIIKSLYWPIVFGSMFFITFFVFI